MWLCGVYQPLCVLAEGSATTPNHINGSRNQCWNQWITLRLLMQESHLHSYSCKKNLVILHIFPITWCGYPYLANRKNQFTNLARFQKILNHTKIQSCGPLGISKGINQMIGCVGVLIIMLNKNTLGAKICKANQKQQLNGYTCDQNVWYLAKAKN